MTKNINFNELWKKHKKTLEQYVPVVAKVHGGSHPEFHKIHEVFNTINTKLNESKSEIPNLDEDFVNLKEISTNYTIPEDVCETYEAVYKMLKELDTAYFSH